MSSKKIRDRIEKWKGNIKDASWKRSTAPLLARMDSMHKLLKKKEYDHPDDFFFAIEDLPYMGKEYWFLYFVVPGTDKQVVITAGRSEEPVTVNKSKVKKEAKAGGKIVDCAAVCWMYSDRKDVLIDSGGEVGLEKRAGRKKLFFRKGKNEMGMEGEYPCFDIYLKKGGREVFSAKAVAKKKGLPWEMPRLMENPVAKGFGAVMINYYFDFKGRMEGKPVSGKAYLQKVVATIPLAPWNWVRLEFKNGDALDYFAGKPLGNDVGPQLHFPCNDYVELSGKRLKLEGMQLMSFMDGDTRRWILSGKGIFASMESYSLQPFSMKQKTQFQYDEYLVRVKDFIFKAGNKTYTMKDLGPASGLIEDAYGYLL